MHRKPSRLFSLPRLIALVALIALPHLPALAEWQPVAIDRTIGVSAPETFTLTAGAFPVQAEPFAGGCYPPAASAWTASPTTNTSQRTSTLYTADRTLLLRTISPGTLSPGGANSKLTLAAVTSGVSVALLTYTNGTSPWTTGIWLNAGDTVTCVSTNSTNAVAVASWTQLKTASQTNLLGYAGHLRGFTPGAILPASTTASLSLSIVTSGVTVAIGTFTNNAAAYAPVRPLPFKSGDTLILSSTGVTNPCVSYATVQARINASRAATGLLRSVTPSAILPSLAGTNTVVLSAVTSGVTVALSTFTNGAAAYSPSAPLRLRPGDTLGLTASGLTNAATFTFALQSELATGSSITPDAAPDALKIYSVKLVDPIYPAMAGTNTVILAVAYYGGTATTLHTFTNGAAAYVPSAALLLLPGDAVTLTSNYATNAIRARASAERYVP